MIFLDTNVVAETGRREANPDVLRWLAQNDGETAMSSIVIAELAFGIEKLRFDERSPKLLGNLMQWRQRKAGRIFAFDEDSAVIYGRIMGERKLAGRPMVMGDGMIAAVALRHAAPLATRNVRDFEALGLVVINPWDASP